MNDPDGVDIPDNLEEFDLPKPKKPKLIDVKKFEKNAKAIREGVELNTPRLWSKQEIIDLIKEKV